MTSQRLFLVYLCLLIPTYGLLAMNRFRKSLNLLTGSFPSASQTRSIGESCVRYVASSSGVFDSSENCDEIAPDNSRYDNITEGLRQLNSSWEFGTFPQTSKPTSKELEDFEAMKLKNKNAIRTDAFWVNALTDEEVDRAIVELSKYCSKERLERFDEVLNKRTSNIRMVSCILHSDRRLSMTISGTGTVMVTLFVLHAHSLRIAVTAVSCICLTSDFMEKLARLFVIWCFDPAILHHCFCNKSTHFAE